MTHINLEYTKLNDQTFMTLMHLKNKKMALANSHKIKFECDYTNPTITRNVSKLDKSRRIRKAQNAYDETKFLFKVLWTARRRLQSTMSTYNALNLEVMRELATT
jgi:DNA-binding MarR family transcriptional regulator